MNKKWKNAGVIAVIMFLMSSTVSFAGTWEQMENEWLYKKDDGHYAMKEWVQDPADGAWYYFDRYGIMESNHLIDGYYLGPDGRMLSETDVANPLYGETIYGTCYMKADGYENCGDHFKVRVSLYDSSFGLNEELGKYRVGDYFWIEDVKAYGTVNYVAFSTGGDITITVRYGSDEYRFTEESAGVSSLVGEGEGQILRKIKDDVEIIIPKDVEIVPVSTRFSYVMTLEDFLNNDWYKAIPLFDGITVKRLYDDIINYAG